MIKFLCNPSRHDRPCATGRGQGRAVAASSGTPLFVLMPGLVPGMTVGGMPAGRNPCPNPASGPVTRLYQRLAPGPAHLNRTAMDLFRVSTSLGRFVRSRFAPRCRKTWIPGTSPGMTVGGMPRAEIGVSGRAIPWKPAGTQAIHPARKIQTGQQWTCSGHDGVEARFGHSVRNPAWDGFGCRAAEFGTVSERRKNPLNSGV